MSYQYDFAICATFQNEAPYLKEWIEYHRIVGAQHFYLYNNVSQDNYQTVLQPYVNAGIIEIVDWPESDFQSHAYMDAIHKTSGKVKWLGLINIDEYLVTKVSETIPEFLAQFEKVGIGGVAINWQLFGTSYVPSIHENQLLTEVLTLKAAEEYPENQYVKSIVRPEFVVEPPGVHSFNYREGYSQVNTDQEVFTGAISPYIATDKMQINHYWAKDENFLNTVKIPNLNEPLENIESHLNALNKVHDTAIEPYLAELRENMFSELAESWISSNPNLAILSDTKSNNGPVLETWKPITNSSLHLEIKVMEAEIPVELVAEKELIEIQEITPNVAMPTQKLPLPEYSLWGCVAVVTVIAYRFWRSKAIMERSA